MPGQPSGERVGEAWRVLGRGEMRDTGQFHQLGILRARAICRAAAGGVTASRSPTTISTGTRAAASTSVESGRAAIARCAQATVAARHVRGDGAPVRPGPRRRWRRRDQRGDRVGAGRDVPPSARSAAARRRSSAAASSAPLRVSTSTSPATPLRMPAQHRHRDVPAHRHPADNRPVDARRRPVRRPRRRPAGRGRVPAAGSPSAGPAPNPRRSGVSSRTLAGRASRGPRRTSGSPAGRRATAPVAASRRPILPPRPAGQQIGVSQRTGTNSASSAQVTTADGSSESIRSITPPCPGSRLPMSLTPRSRLISDSARSPTGRDDARPRRR